MLPAYRIGRRRVALKRTDLTTLIVPAGADRRQVGGSRTTIERPQTRRLTTEDQRRGLQALERAEALSKRILERRGGKPFSPSWEILDELRDERSRPLA